MRNLMAGITRPVLRRLRRDERGVVGVLVAILLGSGVLMGLGALVIDVGQLYQERAELQNGADAGALAVAKSCATGTCTPSLAAQYANENASALTGHTAAASLVCGSSALFGPACPASSHTALIDCPADPTTIGLGWVDVRTSTFANGSTILPASFAKTLLGNSGYVGSTVQACSQAVWGSPSSANTVAFAISGCSWDSWTAGPSGIPGTDYAPAPPTVPSPSYDHQINLANVGNGGGCPGETLSSADGPGVFGWAVDQTSTCGIFTSTITFQADPGASAGSSCHDALIAAQASRKAILLPVYTQVTSANGKKYFNLKGFAAFVVTGYSLPSFSASDWLNPLNNSCSYKCIDGYFTKQLLPPTSGTNENGTYLGVAVIGLTG